MNLQIVARISEHRAELIEYYGRNKWPLIQSTLSTVWKDYPDELRRVRSMAAKPGVPHKLPKPKFVQPTLFNYPNDNNAGNVRPA